MEAADTGVIDARRQAEGTRAAFMAVLTGTAVPIRIVWTGLFEHFVPLASLALTVGFFAL